MKLKIISHFKLIEPWILIDNIGNKFSHYCESRYQFHDAVNPPWPLINEIEVYNVSLQVQTQ